MGRGQRQRRAERDAEYAEWQEQALRNLKERECQEQKSERRAQFIAENPTSDAERFIHFDEGLSLLGLGEYLTRQPFRPGVKFKRWQDLKRSAVKKSYKRLAIKCHPDKGGDASEFMVLQKGYEAVFWVLDKYNIDVGEQKAGAISVRR